MKNIKSAGCVNMADEKRTKLNGLVPVVTLEKVGDSCVGYYNGAKEIKSDEFINGVATLHQFTGKDGKDFAVWGGAVINSTLKPEHIGKVISIKREKDIPAKKKGNNPTRMYDIELIE